MDWSNQGSETFMIRKELFEKQKKIVEEEIVQLERVLDMIKYKCWYYDEAIKFGNESNVIAMIPDKLPQQVKKNYENSH
jgi:hypothetical protein